MIEFGEELAKPLVLSIAFTIVGVALFVVCLWIVDRITPFSIQREIEQDQNIALGIIIGSLILGIAMILSASLLDISVTVPIVQESPPASQDDGGDGGQ